LAHRLPQQVQPALERRETSYRAPRPSRQDPKNGAWLAVNVILHDQPRSRCLKLAVEHGGAGAAYRQL
jgi:hypothetical protein